MKKLLAVAVASLLSITALALPADAVQPGAIRAQCSSHSASLDTRMTRRPVVFVHGWTSSAAGSEEAVQALETRLGGGYRVLAFDYSDVNTVWGAKGDAKACLASYLTRASDSFKAGGGDGKVLAVGHSMGGIVIRAASGVLAGDNKEEILAGVVTIGTPMQGSHWGGTVYPRLVEWGKSVTNDPKMLWLPPETSSAALCLAAPLPGSCERFPYLPEGTKYASVASQIIIERRLFGLKSMSAEVPIFGDAIVPVQSATGYLGSSPGTYRAGGGMRETIIECKHTAGYLSDQLLTSRVNLNIPAKVIASLLLANVEIFLDTRALDAMMAGKADPSQFPLFLQGFFSDCFHGSLPTNAKAVEATADYLEQMAANANEGVPNKPTDNPTASGTSKQPMDIGDAAGLTGTWKGAAYGAQNWYDLVLTLSYTDGVLSGSADYPQLQCGGTWTDMKLGATSITGTEEIKYDATNRCVKKLTVTVTRTSDGLHVSYDGFGTMVDLKRQ